MLAFGIADGITLASLLKKIKSSSIFRDGGTSEEIFL